MDAVRNLPGVRAVYPDTMVYETMDASLPLINAKAMWWTLGGRRRAGKGMKVAVIDSGIRPENPMFDGSHFHMPAGYPLSDDYCATTDPSLCNGKIIVARYYEPTFTIHVNEKLSPIGLSGHGTHTAGSAVGNLVRYADAGDGVLEKISGVAPGA